MSKPEDIPQDVWDAAAKVAGSPNVYMGKLSRQIVMGRISRAILDATGAEREACAVLADERANISADAVAKINAGELYGGVPLAAATESCAGLEAGYIAILIRKRGEVNTAHKNSGDE